MLSAVGAHRGVAPMAALVEEPEEAEEGRQSNASMTKAELPDTTADSRKSPTGGSDTVSSVIEHVSLSGGPPWGFVFEGGAEFQCELIIAYIQPNSAAANSGVLKVGDRILGVGNTLTNDGHALTLELIRSTPPGQNLELRLLRAKSLQCRNNNKENVTKSPSAHSLHSETNNLTEDDDTSSQSSAASLPENLLSKSVSTLQRNCPARRSEVMLSTLVRKLQDSLPRRNSERHQHHPMAGSGAQSPKNNGYSRQAENFDSNGNFYNGNQQNQHQQQPKVKKALVSSFSFSLGRAPRPSGLSQGCQNGGNPGGNGTPINTSKASSPPVTLEAAQQQAAEARVPSSSIYQSTHQSCNNMSAMHHQASLRPLYGNHPDCQTQMNQTPRHPPYQPTPYGHGMTSSSSAIYSNSNLNTHRMSASVVNLPYCNANSWHNQSSSNSGVFAFDNPLDCDSVPNAVPTRPPLAPNPTVVANPASFGQQPQFASCDQLNSNYLINPTSSYHLSRGVRSPPSQSIAETGADNDGSQRLKVSQSFDKIAPVNDVNPSSHRMSWALPSPVPSQSQYSTCNGRPGSLIIPDESSSRPTLHSSASFANYARCIPSRRPNETSLSASQITGVVRPANNKFVIASRPSSRVSPQYGSNHQLYYRDSITATSPVNGRPDTTSPQGSGSSSSPSFSIDQTKVSPPQLPPRRYALEEIRGYISPPNAVESNDLPASTVDDGDYADQLRLQSRSLIAATGSAEKRSPQEPKGQPPIKPFMRDQYPRQVALIAPLLATTPERNENSKVTERVSPQNKPPSPQKQDDNPADQSIVSVQLPSQDLTNGHHASSTISVSKSNSPPPQNQTDSSNKTPSNSYFCDVDTLATTNDADSSNKPTNLVATAPSPLITQIPDNCIMEPMEDGSDSAFADLSPGAYQSSASSSSGRRGNASARSTGTNSLQSATSGTTSAPVAVVTTTGGNKSKSGQVQISLFTKQRSLLPDEIRCDQALRGITREVSANQDVESILHLASSSVGQYLFQVAAVSSSQNSPQIHQSDGSCEALTDDDPQQQQQPSVSEMLKSARVALAKKCDSLKTELEEIERSLEQMKIQRKVLIDKNLATSVKNIDDEAVDRLKSRLDELEMGALLAVRVASRAARLSPTASPAGKCSSREWRMAVEKLDDVRDVIDSLRQRIAGALSSRMLLTAICDSDLAEIAAFINSFGQQLFEYHEVSELVVIAEQQVEAFESLCVNISSTVGTTVTTVVVD